MKQLIDLEWCVLDVFILYIICWTFLFLQLGVLLHGSSLWNKAQCLDPTLRLRNQALNSTECHTFLAWESCPEGVLRNFLYNKFVKPQTFESTTHYSLINDEEGVVSKKVYEVSLPMCHYYSLSSHLFSLFSGCQIHLDALPQAHSSSSMSLSRCYWPQYCLWASTT